MTIPPRRKRHPQAQGFHPRLSQTAPPQNPRHVAGTFVEGHRCRACKTSSSDSTSTANPAARPETTSHPGTQLQETNGAADDQRTGCRNNSARHPYRTTELPGIDWKQLSLRREEHLRRGERPPHRQRAPEEQLLKKGRTGSGGLEGREMEAPSPSPAKAAVGRQPGQDHAAAGTRARSARAPLDNRTSRRRPGSVVADETAPELLRPRAPASTKTPSESPPTPLSLITISISIFIFFLPPPTPHLLHLHSTSHASSTSQEPPPPPPMAAATVSVRFHPAASAARCGGGSRRSRRLSGVIRAQSAPASAAAAALTQDDLKRLAAVRAVEQVESGMVLGLGTGSTAAFAVAEIGALLASGKLSGIVGVPTSKRTFEQAQSLGIPLSTLDDHPRIDLAIDGADEVDPDLNLVKGRGGALLREKMVEAASDKFIVVVDETKLVTGLGGSGLAMPVEVVQFCWKYNQVRLQDLFNDEGCEAKLRLDEGGKPYVTDNSNYIVDLYFKTPIKDALAAGKEISALEGVVEHGLFLDMATSVIIAGTDGVSVKTNAFNLCEQ
uniref:ribose-5-phosphate isomerase n=1 Tax=Oryza nivara TaxID=4536 RepID=A0A0E0HXB4_ORYNI